MTCPELVLLDVNAVLNAALLSQSFTAQAVALAKQVGNSQFLVSAGVRRELEKTLNDKSPNQACRSAAAGKVNDLLHAISATAIADDDLSPAPGLIQKCDGHLFHAANRTGAAVLTSDAGLWWGCRVNNVRAMLPLAMIRQMAGITLQSTIFGVAPTETAGSIFIRAYPGAWSGGRAGKFTVVTFPGGFWLYYDATNSCWVAAVEGLGRPLAVKGLIQVSAIQTVCLSWDALGNSPAITLRVSGCVHPDTAPLNGPMGFRPSGLSTVGSLCGRDHFWNGSIYFCISNDKPVSAKSWKAYKHHSDLAPNPYDADRLMAAIKSLCNNSVSSVSILL